MLAWSIYFRGSQMGPDPKSSPPILHVWPLVCFKNGADLVPGHLSFEFSLPPPPKYNREPHIDFII